MLEQHRRQVRALFCHRERVEQLLLDVGDVGRAPRDQLRAHVLYSNAVSQPRVCGTEGWRTRQLAQQRNARLERDDGVNVQHERPCERCFGHRRNGAIVAAKVAAQRVEKRPQRRVAVRRVDARLVKKVPLRPVGFGEPGAALDTRRQRTAESPGSEA